MMRLAKFVVVGLFVVSGVAMAGEWNRGIQTAFPQEEWPRLLESLRAAKPDRAPYRLTKRTRGFDYEVHIVTPFSAAADEVRNLEKGAAPVTYDSVAGHLGAQLLKVNLQTTHRSREGAESVVLALRADGRLVQPTLDQIQRTQLKSIGFYAEPYYVVERTFGFSLADVATAKKLSVVIFESDSKKVELPVDVEELR